MADVTIPFWYLENFARTVHGIDAVSQDMLADALANTDVSDKRAVRTLMRAVCQTSNEQAQELATAFYRGLSLMETGVDMTKRVKSGWDATATDIAVNAILRDYEDDPEGMARQLSSRVSFEVNRASKRGVWRAGQADGREVRYARVPVGVETCAWCLMTAGLGYWYMTEESASHSHAHCDCAIVAAIGGIQDVHIDGYDSTVYRDMWRNAREMLANGDVPQDVLDRINAEKAKKGKKYRVDTNGVLAVMRLQYGLK